MATVHDLIKTRNKHYGDFETEAMLIQELNTAVLYHAESVSEVELSPLHREAIHMILHKIGRIANGNPNHADSWQDIAGYAQMVVDYIEKDR